MDQAGVSAIMHNKGQSMLLKRVSHGIIDPITGSIGTVTTQTWTVYGITKNYNLLEKGGGFNERGTMTMSGDKKALIDAGVVDPLPGDILTIMGVNWAVITVDALSPQGVNLMFTLQVRK